MFNEKYSPRTSLGREHPHILFIGEKWCDANPACGDTNSFHSFLGPLEVSGLGTYDVFHFDEYYYHHKKPGDAALIDLIEKTRPDYIFIIWIWSEWTHNNPLLETLYHIRNTFKIPMATWWGDTHSSTLMSMSEILAPYLDVTFAGDSRDSFRKFTQRPDRYVFMPHPKDTRLFCDPGLDRDIPVCFVGSVADRSDRQRGIELLRQAGINVVKRGGQREQKLSPQDYAATYQRSKIAIDFVELDGFLKGRIMEATLCGALLLEPERSGAKELLRPGLDFVTYTDESDLVNKVKYYLEHDAERREIAERGRDQARIKFNGTDFWSETFRILDRESKYSREDAALALASKFARSGKLQQAKLVLQEILGQTTMNCQALKSLGDILIKEEKWSAAQTAYERSLGANSLWPEARLGLAECYSRQGNHEAALNLLLEIKNRGLCADGLDEKILEVIWRAGNLRLFLELSTQLVQEYPGEPRYYVQLARVLQKIGEVQAASELIGRARDIKYPSQDLSALLIQYFRELNQPLEVEAEIIRASLPRSANETWDVLPEVVKHEYLGETSECLRLLESHAPNSGQKRLIDKLEALRANRNNDQSLQLQAITELPSLNESPKVPF